MANYGRIPVPTDNLSSELVSRAEQIQSTFWGMTVQDQYLDLKKLVKLYASTGVPFKKANYYWIAFKLLEWARGRVGGTPVTYNRLNEIFNVGGNTTLGPFLLNWGSENSCTPYVLAQIASCAKDLKEEFGVTKEEACASILQGYRCNFTNLPPEQLQLIKKKIARVWSPSRSNTTEEAKDVGLEYAKPSSKFDKGMALAIEGLGELCLDLTYVRGRRQQLNNFSKDTQSTAIQQDFLRSQKVVTEEIRACEVLGVKYDTSLKEIRKIGKKLLAKFHPDKYTEGSTEQVSATKRFQEVQWALGIFENSRKGTND